MLKRRLSDKITNHDLDNLQWRLTPALVVENYLVQVVVGISLFVHLSERKVAKALTSEGNIV